MELDNIYDIACNGTPDDLIGLLKAYGDAEAVRPYKSPLDMMTSGAAKSISADDRAKKMSLIAAYVGKRGDFAETRETSPDVLRELSELRENVADLTRQVRELQDAAATRDIVKGLRASIQTSAAAKKGPAPGN